MRILQLVVNCPWPPITGGEIRNDMIARAAAKLGPFACRGLTAILDENASAGFSYRSAPGFADKNPWVALKPALPTKIRLSDADLAWLLAEAHEFNPDVIIVEGVVLADALPMLRRNFPCVILDMHNIESQLQNQIRQAQPWEQRVKSLVLLPFAASNAKKLDVQASQTADLVWTCSNFDRDTLIGLGGPKSTIITNPVPNHNYLDIPISDLRYTSPSLIYCGLLSYPPNTKAVTELALHIFPRVAQHMSVDAPLVVGRKPNKLILHLAQLGHINLVADRPDILPLIAASSYTILPIRVGGGTRIKALEAMAAGLIMIATAKAVEGLDLVDGLHFVQAETAQAMADALAGLVTNPEKAVAIAKAARAFVIANYARSIVENQVFTALTKAAAQKFNRQVA